MADAYYSRASVERWIRESTASLDTDADREAVIERMRSEIVPSDVEPVVRCRNCIHARPLIGGSGIYHRCEIFKMPFTSDNYYCAWGVRSEREGKNATP